MNIHRALIYARKYDKAIRRKGWHPNVYIQHGMDNFLRFPEGRECPLAIAELLATDWHLAGAPYQQTANDGREVRGASPRNLHGLVGGSVSERQG